MADHYDLDYLFGTPPAPPAAPSKAEAEPMQTPVVDVLLTADDPQDIAFDTDAAKTRAAELAGQGAARAAELAGQGAMLAKQGAAAAASSARVAAEQGRAMAEQSAQAIGSAARAVGQRSSDVAKRAGEALRAQAPMLRRVLLTSCAVAAVGLMAYAGWLVWEGREASDDAAEATHDDALGPVGGSAAIEYLTLPEAPAGAGGMEPWLMEQQEQGGEGMAVEEPAVQAEATADVLPSAVAPARPQQQAKPTRAAVKPTPAASVQPAAPAPAAAARSGDLEAVDAWFDKRSEQERRAERRSDR